MHIGTEEINQYLLTSASVATCCMISLLCKNGLHPQSVSDDDWGMSIHTSIHCKDLAVLASTQDNWATGTITLQGIDGTQIARLGLLFDDEYMALTLAMIKTLADEVYYRLGRWRTLESAPRGSTN